jgi:hypothetical protein
MSHTCSRTLLCQTRPAILSVTLKRPCPFAHLLPVLRSQRRTAAGMPDSAVRHSLLGMALSAPILAGSRRKTSRTGGFARFRRRIEASVRSRTAPWRNCDLLQLMRSGKFVEVY